MVTDAKSIVEELTDLTSCSRVSFFEETLEFAGLLRELRGLPALKLGASSSSPHRSTGGTKNAQFRSLFSSFLDRITRIKVVQKTESADNTKGVRFLDCVVQFVGREVLFNNYRYIPIGLLEGSDERQEDQ